MRGEPGIAAVDVTLTGTDDLGNVIDVTVQTDVDGNYAFTDLRPSDAAGYTITETQPAGVPRRDRHGRVPGWRRHCQRCDLRDPGGSGDAGAGYTFGEVLAGSLSGSVFEDLNNDGVFDPGEVGVAGVDVTLTGTDDLGNAIDITVQTDVDGDYPVHGSAAIGRRRVHDH